MIRVHLVVYEHGPAVAIPFSLQKFTIIASSAVQCILEYHILIPGNSGLDRCRLPRQHAGSREVEERPRDALVGEVPDVQRRQQERRVLHIAIQFEQIFPSHLEIFVHVRVGAGLKSYSFS